MRLSTQSADSFRSPQIDFLRVCASISLCCVPGGEQPMEHIQIAPEMTMGEIVQKPTVTRSLQSRCRRFANAKRMMICCTNPETVRLRVL